MIPRGWKVAIYMFPRLRVYIHTHKYMRVYYTCMVLAWSGRLQTYVFAECMHAYTGSVHIHKYLHIRCLQWGWKVAIDVFADCVFVVDIMVQMHAAYFIGNAEDGKVRLITVCVCARARTCIGCQCMVLMPMLMLMLTPVDGKISFVTVCILCVCMYVCV